jgi:hypothetical protein
MVRKCDISSSTSEMDDDSPLGRFLSVIQILTLTLGYQLRPLLPQGVRDREVHRPSHRVLPEDRELIFR